jgi:3-isopropylmalate/(R)-2-methylmalate dehydratase small subunit
MTPFTTLSSIAAPLLEDNIDTDVIFPARFLLLLDLAGVGRNAFHDRRYKPDGAERAGFVLNQPAYRAARILLAGANFGSGSSREQAVWCLADFGIACVIAPSFGDIFAANCRNNGVLPIVLPAETIAALAQDGAVTVDLETQRVTSTSQTAAFAIEPEAREALLQGWDVTDRILQRDGPAIATFEARHRAAQFWLF